MLAAAVAMSTPTAASPLETVTRNHGAAMASRHGRRVPAHFGSVGAEEAVCLRSVGMADRSDRDTFELRGTSGDLENALVAVGEYAWCSFVSADRALVRSEHEHASACASLLANLEGLTASNRTAAYAAIGLIGPRAKQLLMEIDLNPSGVIIQEARGCYEVILPAERGPELWEYLLDAGAPYGLACVGHDALDRLAVAHRFDQP
jgi:glycine cleavage system aminomethyltransferase T